MKNIEIVLLLITLSLIGWYVWDNYLNKPSTKEDSGESSNPPITTNPLITTKLKVTSSLFTSDLVSNLPEPNITIPSFIENIVYDVKNDPTKYDINIDYESISNNDTSWTSTTSSSNFFKK